MRSQKQQIATLRLPRFDVRKNRSKRSIKNLDRAVINVVGLDPLEKHAAGLQTPVDRLVVLPGKKSRHARPIGIGRAWRDFLPGSTTNRSTGVCSPAACFSNGSKPTTLMTARSRFFIERLDRFLRTSNRGKRRVAICCFWLLMNRSRTMQKHYATVWRRSPSDPPWQQRGVNTLLTIF